MKGFNAGMAASNDDEVYAAQQQHSTQSSQSQNQQHPTSMQVGAGQQQQHQLHPSQQHHRSSGGSHNAMDEMMQQDLQLLASEAPLDGGESTFGGAYSQLGAGGGGAGTNTELTSRTPTPFGQEDMMMQSSAGSILEPPSDFRELSERPDANGSVSATAEALAAEHLVSLEQLAPDNVARSDALGKDAAAAGDADNNAQIARPTQTAGFLVSFMVDARGGTMRGCRHSGVRVIIPPGAAQQPMRITCRYLRRERLVHPPPLMEGEACASKIMEVGPAGARFLNNVLIEVPHFASLRGKEREIIILRSDSGDVWREHTVDANAQQVIDNLLNEADSFPTGNAAADYYPYPSTAADEPLLSDKENRPASRSSTINNKQQSTTTTSNQQQSSEPRLTRIITTEFPQYFAIISRIKQDVHAIGPDGATVNASNVPKVQAIFTEGALTKRIKIGLQPKKEEASTSAKLADQQQDESSKTENNAASNDSITEHRPASAASGRSSSAAGRLSRPPSSQQKRRRRFLACFGAKNGSVDLLDAASDSSETASDSNKQPCDELPVKKRHIIGDISDSESVASASAGGSPKQAKTARRTSHLVPEDYYIEKEAPLILNSEPSTYGKRLASSGVQTDAKLQNGSISTRVGKSRRRNVLLRGPKRRRKTQMTIKCVEPASQRQQKQSQPKNAATTDATDTSLESNHAANEPEVAGEQRPSALANTAAAAADDSDLFETSSIIRDVFTSDDQKWRTCLIQTDSDSVTVNYVTISSEEAAANALSDASASKKTLADASTATSGQPGDDGYVSGSGDLQRPHSSSAFGKGLFGVCGSANTASDTDEVSEEAAEPSAAQDKISGDQETSGAAAATSAHKRGKRVKKQLAPEAGPQSIDAEATSADEVSSSAAAAAASNEKEQKRKQKKLERAEQVKHEKEQRQKQKELDEANKLKRKQEKEAKRAEKAAAKLNRKLQRSASGSPEPALADQSLISGTSAADEAPSSISASVRGLSAAKEVTFAADSKQQQQPEVVAEELSRESPVEVALRAKTEELQKSASVAPETPPSEAITADTLTESVSVQVPRPILKQTSISVSTAPEVEIDGAEDEEVAEVVISSEHKLQRKMSAQPVELSVASDEAVKLADSLKDQSTSGGSQLPSELASRLQGVASDSKREAAKKAKEEKQRIKREAEERKKEAKLAAKQAKEAKKAAEVEAKRVAKAAKEAEKLAAKVRAQSPSAPPLPAEEEDTKEKKSSGELIAESTEAAAEAVETELKLAVVEPEVGSEDASKSKSEKKEKKKKKDKKKKKKEEADESTGSEPATQTQSKSTSSFFGRLFSGKSKSPKGAETGDATKSESKKADAVAKGDDNNVIVSEMYSSDPNDANAEMILEVNVPKELIDAQQQQQHAISSPTLSATSVSQHAGEPQVRQQVTSTVESYSVSVDADKTSAAIEPLRSVQIGQDSPGHKQMVASSPTSGGEEDEATLVNISGMVTVDDDQADDATENIVSQSETIDAFPSSIDNSFATTTATKKEDAVQQQLAPEQLVANELVDEAIESATTRLHGGESSSTKRPEVVESLASAASSLKDEKNRRKLESKLAKEAKKQAAEEAKLEKKRLEDERKLAAAEAKKKAKEEKQKAELEAQEAKRLAAVAKQEAKQRKKDEKEAAKRAAKEAAELKKTKKNKKGSTSVEASEASEPQVISSSSTSGPILSDAAKPVEDTVVVSSTDDHKDAPATATTTEEGHIVLDTSEAVPVSEETQVERIVEEHVEDDGTVTKRTKTVETKLITMRQEELRMAERRELPADEWQREEEARRLRSDSVDGADMIVTIEKRAGLPVLEYENDELNAIRATPSYFDPERIPDEIKAKHSKALELESMSPKKLQSKRVKLNEKLIKRAKKLSKTESKRAKREANKAKAEIAVCDEAARSARKQLRLAVKESRRAMKLVAKEHKRMDKIDKKLSKNQKKLDKRQKKLDKKASKASKKLAKKQEKEAKKEAKRAAKLAKSASSQSSHSSGSLKRSTSGSKKSIKLEDIGEPILRSSSRLSIGAGGSVSNVQQPQVAALVEEEQPQSGEEMLQVSLDLDGRIAAEMPPVETLDAMRNELVAELHREEDIVVDVVGDGVEEEEQRETRQNRQAEAV